MNLAFEQAGIYGCFANQFIMSSSFHQTPVFDDQDAVGVFQGGKPVSDDQRCAMGHQIFQGILDDHFCFCIDGCCGFIQNDDRRIFQKYAGNGNAMSLPA